jgi:AcrR family transcriptional regulator
VLSISAIAVTEERARELRVDAQRNRERIIVAALEVFAERGLDASTAEIAHRAGVGEATLFRRFPSKDDLIMAIVETQMDETIALAEECASAADPGAGVERFLREMVERSVRDRGVLEAAKDRCIMRPELTERRRRVIALMSDLVKRGQAEGAVREDLSATDLGMLISIAASTSEFPFPGLREDLWKRYLQVILDGLRPDGATRLRPGPPPRKLFERNAE